MTKIALIAATALVLNTATALASSQSSDNGFAISQQSIQKSPAVAHRVFLSGSDVSDQIINSNARDAIEFRKTQADPAIAHRVFLSGSDVSDHITNSNARDAIEFRKTQEQGR